MRRLTAKFIVVLLLALLLTGCQTEPKNEYSKYSESFFDTFDTLVNVVAYTKSEQEFNAYFQEIHARFQELHKMYDIYNDYEGINNIKTINDNAGIKPVKVDREIIDLILFAKEWYKRTDGQTNIAMGSVLRIWHEYREQGLYDPPNAKLPPMEDLLDAAKHTDIDKVIVDEENSTVYLADKRMSLDVGAVAKGYAVETVAKEVMAQGLESGIINAGGNIRVIGKPLDGIRERWGIGIQNPDKSIISNNDDNLLDTVFVNNASVVSSGDYQRYYIVDGKLVHHLIDPKTLMPGEYYSAVTIVTEDSGLADLLSTAVFLMPYEQGRALVDSLDGVEAVWVMHDGKTEATDGMKKIMKSNGATGAK
ncbi:MAG: FAD:protein FMN transferase [Firmicutes bacterium]|nr:FAD:protein FMN transferase [Bacillota bacterium]MDI6706894.1 FAD:protein FMN transferase [Bacillota bacterium]